MLRAKLICEALTKRLLDVRTESALRLRVFSEAGDQQFADQVIIALARPQVCLPFAAWSPCDSTPASMVAGPNGLEMLRQIAIGESVGILEGLPPVALDGKAFAQLTTADRFALLVGLGFPYSITRPEQEWLREELLRQTMVPDRRKLEERRLSELDHDFILLKLNMLALVSVVHADLRYLDAVNFWYERLPASWEPAGDHKWLLASLVGIYMQALSITASWWQECASPY